MTTQQVGTGQGEAKARKVIPDGREDKDVRRFDDHLIGEPGKEGNLSFARRQMTTLKAGQAT